LRIHLGGEHLPARMIELVHSAALHQLVGKRDGSVGACLGRAQLSGNLPGGDRADIGAPRFGGEAQGLLGGDQLRPLEADTCEP
jgi:hypothetical protein